MIKHGKSGIETEKIWLIIHYTKLSTFGAFQLRAGEVYALSTLFEYNCLQLGYKTFSHESNEVIRMLKCA